MIRHSETACGLFVATVMFAAVAVVLSGCSEGLLDEVRQGEECDEEGAVEGPYECRDGVWVSEETPDAGFDADGADDVDDPDDADDCESESDDELCDLAGYTCGELTETDDCGDQRTVDCGGCSEDDGWYDVDSEYACCDGDDTCQSCQDQEYREYYCDQGSCSWEVTDERTEKSDCSSCDDEPVDGPYGCNRCREGACSVESYCDPDMVVEVFNPGNEPLEDHQVDVYIDTRELIDAGEMNPDCSGLRVVDPDDGSELDHWIVEGCDTDSTELWIRAPYLPPKVVVPLHLFFGDPELDSAQDPEATMEFYEDFSSGNYDDWTTGGTTNDSGGGYDHSLVDDDYVVGGHAMSIDIDGNCHSSPYDGTDAWMYRQLSLTDSDQYALDFTSRVDDGGQYSFCSSDEGGRTVDKLEARRDDDEITGGHTCSYDEACQLCSADDWGRTSGVFDGGDFELTFYARASDCKQGLLTWDRIFVRKHAEPQPVSEIADD